MPADPLVLLLFVVTGANLLLLLAVLVFVWPSRRAAASADRAGTSAIFASDDDRPPDPDRLDLMLSGATPFTTFEHVVRVAGWGFLLVSAIVVAASGEWVESRDTLLAILGVAGVAFLVVNELMPTQLLGAWKFVIEGSGAIVLITLLVALTGQAMSPFFFAYAAIVVGGALVIRPVATLGLTVACASAYVLAIVADPAALPIEPLEAAFVAVSLGGLCLLAYVTTVVAREQRRTRDEALRLSTLDPLTGLFNRAYFFAIVERELDRSARSRRGFCLLMADLDGLKAVNDSLGHHEGDRVLRAIADVIRAGVRRIDVAARYGGDEFVILLPETDATGAYTVAEKIRRGVAALVIPAGRAAIHPSVSIGVVAYPDDGTSVDNLFVSADQAMYASKRRGKNRIAGFMPLRAVSGEPHGFGGEPPKGPGARPV